MPFTAAPFTPQLPRFLGLVVLGLFARVILEALVRRYVMRRPTDFRGVAASLADAVVRRGADVAGLTLAAPLPALAWSHRLATMRMDSAAAWLGLYLLVEFFYYWHHRATHRVRFLWATHSVHHSSNELMLASAVRLGWTGRLGGAVAFFSVLVWVGYPAPAVFGVVVFDRLFGTFVALRPDVRIRYGLTHPVLSHNPLRIAFGGWLALVRDLLAARGTRARLAVPFGPP